MKMRFRKLAYLTYSLVRNVVRATGLTGPLRRTVGPLAGRLVFQTASNFGRPMVVHGHRMYLASRGGYPPVGMALGRYEEETTRLFERITKPGMVVIDVGAHVGYYSLLAARRVGPQGKVYAFEPEPANYALLLKNIELNGYGNIVAAREGVSNRVAPATLFLTRLDSGRHSIYHHGLPEKGSVAVETTTLDAFLEAEGWPRVDLIKVDVEGAEWDVLEGMEQLLQRPARLKLILEFNPFLLQSAGVDPFRFLERPDSWRFKVYCIDEGRGLLPLDQMGVPWLVERLLARQSSVNLLCSRE